MALTLPPLSDRWAHITSSRQAGPFGSLGCQGALLACGSGDKPGEGDSDNKEGGQMKMLVDGPLGGDEDKGSSADFRPCASL